MPISWLRSSRASVSHSSPAARYFHHVVCHSQVENTLTERIALVKRVYVHYHPANMPVAAQVGQS